MCHAYSCHGSKYLDSIDVMLHYITINNSIVYCLYYYYAFYISHNIIVMESDTKYPTYGELIDMLDDVEENDGVMLHIFLQDLENHILRVTYISAAMKDFWKPLKELVNQLSHL